MYEHVIVMNIRVESIFKNLSLIYLPTVLNNIQELLKYNEIKKYNYNT